MNVWHKLQKELTYVRVITIGYIFVTVVGTLLLMLPVATADGKTTDLFTAFFTAASSTCVTGLVVVDTGIHWSMFGQLVILAMIQIGGLGFVTVCVLVFMLLKKKITLKTRGLLQESMNGMQIGGGVKLVRLALIGTLCMEALGALVLCIRFIPLFGMGKGVYYSIFHAVSAFCNAGIEIMGPYYGAYSSFTGFQGDVLVNLVLIVLTIVGGIGFFVWSDLQEERFRIKKCALHTRMTIVMSVVLLLVGAVLYYVFENDNLFLGMKTGEKVLTSFFCSTMTRTTGFNSIEIAELSNASRLLTIVLSFIGGSPGSTAGGIKTVTLFVLLEYIWSNLKGGRSVTVFGRRLDDETIQKASNVLVLSLVLAITGIAAICYMQPELALEDVVMEVVSSIGTAGISTGITRRLCTGSRIVVILLMYCGRIGSMSFALSIVQQKKRASVQLPVEKIMIG